MPSVYKSATITGPLNRHLLFFRLVLVSRDLGVLPLCLLHETGESVVLDGGDGLGLKHRTAIKFTVDCQLSEAIRCTSYYYATHPHGNVDVTIELLNLLSDLAQSLLHQLDRRVLIRTSRAHHIERRSDQSDLDGYLFGGQGLPSTESGLDTVDTLVRVTSEFEIRSDLDGLGGESSGDGGEEFRADFRGHVEGFKDGVGFAIARGETQVFPVSTTRKRIREVAGI